MSPDKWQFLDKWLYHGRLDVGRFNPTHHAEGSYSIAPRASISIWLKSDDCNEVQSSARTLELMASAVRVDERVWEKLYPVGFGNPYLARDWSQYRPGDLKLQVEARVQSDRSPSRYFEPMAAACDADRTGPTSVAAYLDAQRRISELDIRRRLCEFQIPLTFSLLFENSKEAHCIASLERLVTSGCVAVRGAANSPKDHEGRRAVYILEAVKIAPFIERYPETLVNLSKGYCRDFDLQALDSQGLTRLQSLGVPITTAVGRVQDDPLFLHWMARDRALTLALLVEGNAELRRFYTTACRLHERLTSLTLCLREYGLDVPFTAMVLSELPRVCPSLWSIELIDTFDRGVWVALREALEAAPLAKASNPVRAFAMVLRRDVLPRHAIPTLAQWLPRLESLTVRPYRARPFATNDASLVLILEAFPRLKALDLRKVSLTTWCVLLDAYETRGCRIRTLALRNHGLSCAPLLEALACPARRISHTLCELEICAGESEVGLNSELQAAEAMLQANRRLDCFQLRLHHLWKQRYQALKRLERFHREPLDKVTRGRDVVLRRLAFLSVEHRAPIPGMHALDANVLSLIFALARSHAKAKMSESSWTLLPYHSGGLHFAI